MVYVDLKNNDCQEPITINAVMSSETQGNNLGRVMSAVQRVVFILIFLFLSTQSHAETIGFLAGSGGLGDDSFNDMTYAGLGKARDELGIDIVVREWEQHLSMDRLMDELIAEGARIIVLNGDQFRLLVDKYVKNGKNIQLILNDFKVEGHPNVKSIVYSQHEASFLAGSLAGLFSKTGRVSFIGAIDIPVVRAFSKGFSEGVAHTAPGTEVAIQYISVLPDYSGFNDPKRGYQLALEQYQQGSDIIFGVAGLSGNGIIRAAKKSQKYAIGVDSNQDHMAKGYVLTSVIKRLDVAVYTEIVETIKNGFIPGTVRYGLENGGMGLSPMRFTRDLFSSEQLKAIESLKQKIIKGEIFVTDYLESRQ